MFFQPFWQPHNRNSARRIQSMGWRADGGLWLLVRGGGLFLSKGKGVCIIDTTSLGRKNICEHSRGKRKKISFF